MRPKWEIQETINSDIPFSEALNKIKKLLLYNRGMNSIQELNFPLDHEYDPFLPVSYTHLTLPTIYSV